MPENYKIATLNIKGMATPPIISVLEEFCKRGNRNNFPTGGYPACLRWHPRLHSLHKHRYHGAGDGGPDTRPYTPYKHRMSPYWLENWHTVPKYNHTDYLRAVWSREEEGQGKLIFERSPILTARHPTIAPGWRRLQKRPYKHGRNRAPKLQSRPARLYQRI